VALPFLINNNDDEEEEEEEEKWIPDLIIVCAGYDALDSDELASCNLIAKNFGDMTRMLKNKMAGLDVEEEEEEEVERNKIPRKKPALMFGLEGGYQLKDGAAGGNLADAFLETLRAL